MKDNNYQVDKLFCFAESRILFCADPSKFNLLFEHLCKLNILSIIDRVIQPDQNNYLQEFLFMIFRETLDELDSSKLQTESPFSDSILIQKKNN